MYDTAQHVRHACRFLLRTPAFTLPAVASLALGIAVNTTIFSVLDATLLRPLAADGSDLVRVFRSARAEREFRSLSREEFAYLRQHASSFAELSGHQIESVPIRIADQPATVSAEIVAGDYFGVLAAQPVLGRSFSAEEDAAPAAAVTVISDRFWRRSFGAHVNVIGRTVLLSNNVFTIVGVAPASFTGAFPGVATDLWLPASTAHLAKPGPTDPSLMLIGRLAAGATASTARAELAVLARRMEAQHIARDRAHVFVLAGARGVHPAAAGPLRVLLLLIMAVVGVVLLIACANVASLLLARGSARRVELAVRITLGASRRRIMTQLLIESLVLACLGGAAGVLLAVWPVQLLNVVSPIAGPTGAALFFNLRIDARVLLFTTALTMLTALFFGLLPAMHATRNALSAALKGAPSGTPRIRFGLRHALVTAQVGLCFILLVAAGLLFRSVRIAARMDVGFDPDGVVVASFDLQTLGFEPADAAAFHTELLERARALPGVERAALASFVALGDRRGHPWPLAVPGATPRSAEDRPTVPVGKVSSDYFATVRQPLLRGREFTAHDGDARVVIVNEALARRYFPADDALGKRIGLGEDLAEYEIIGIAQDARFSSFGGEVQPFALLPAPGEGWLHVRMRGSRPASRTLADVGRLARQMDARIPAPRGQTMRAAMASSIMPARLGQGLFGITGTIALLLAAGGLYGLVYYTLQQRIREIGIRVALGAPRGAVFRVIVGRAVRLAGIGVVLGAAVAAAATRLLSALLYGLSPTDPLTFGGIAALLLLVTLGAGYIAARKGLDADPNTILRHE